MAEKPDMDQLTPDEDEWTPDEDQLKPNPDEVTMEEAFEKLGIDMNKTLRFKDQIGKFVKVKTVNSDEHQGWLKCIDPLTGDMFLITLDDAITRVTRISLIMGDGCKFLEVVKEPTERVTALLDNMDNSIEGISAAMIPDRKQRLLAWIKKNRLPVKEREDGTLVICNNVTISPPYEVEDCYSPNKITLDSARELVAKLPSSIDEEAARLAKQKEKSESSEKTSQEKSESSEKTSQENLDHENSDEKDLVQVNSDNDKEDLVQENSNNDKEDLVQVNSDNDKEDLVQENSDVVEGNLNQENLDQEDFDEESSNEAYSDEERSSEAYSGEERSSEAYSGEESSNEEYSDEESSNEEDFDQENLYQGDFSEENSDEESSKEEDFEEKNFAEKSIDQGN